MSKVKFFFDYKSPFSYLALPQNQKLIEEFHVEIEWKPFSFNVTEGFGIPEKRTAYQNTKLKFV